MIKCQCLAFIQLRLKMTHGERSKPQPKLSAVSLWRCPHQPWERAGNLASKGTKRGSGPETVE